MPQPRRFVKITSKALNLARLRPTTALQLLLALFVVAAVAPPAAASFPGLNGRIAYPGYVNFGVDGYTAIFATDLGQLTGIGNPYPYQDGPAWSPDGSRLAFVSFEFNANFPSGRYLIQILDSSGTHTVLGSDFFVISPGYPLYYQFGHLAWSPDGQNIVFRLNQTSGGYDRSGIWSVTITGIVSKIAANDMHPDQPSYSSQGDLAFLCTGPVLGVYNTRICVVSHGTLNQFPLDPNDPASSVSSISWSPDGNTLLVDGATGFGAGKIPVYGIWRINKDGSGLKPVFTGPNPENNVAPNCPSSYQAFGRPVSSPDGKYIAAVGGTVRLFLVDPYKFCHYIGDHPGLWVMNADGTNPTQEPTPVIGGSDNIGNIDWQPVPQGLTVNILDNHGDPLKALSVQLLKNDAAQTTIDAHPINTAGGTYVFQDGLASGTYLIYATLKDNCGNNCTPAFDIRYGPDGGSLFIDSPIYAEWAITVNSPQPPPFTLNFSRSDPQYKQDNLESNNSTDYLPDLAAIYFRTRQYVDWVKAHLTPSSAPTVSLYAFASVDPLGNAFTSGGAYFPLGHFGNLGPTARILLAPGLSAYTSRDGTGAAPQNGEWHEFTHHLFNNFVYDRFNPSTACKLNYTPHAGYNNPDTCDSMDEGFATFLPTLAGADIGLVTVSTSDLGTISITQSPSGYGNFWDLEEPAYAWQSRQLESGNFAGVEDFALAGVLWDLVAGNGDIQPSAVLSGGLGLPLPVIYNETLANMQIQQLWNIMTTSHTGRVFDLRAALSSDPPSIDLNGDLIPDVAPIDIPFLRHGFYPIDTDQLLTTSHTITFYDVLYATKQSSSNPANSAVGLTSHHMYDAAGAEIPSSGTPPLIPRLNTPLAPNANIALTALDVSGSSLGPATAVLTISYPGGQRNIIRPLRGGPGELVHLELPPYFNYPLPVGALLPPCDPAHDVQVNVTITVYKGGVASTTTPSFNNCTYLHAVAAATTPAALSFTVTVPVVGTSGTPPHTTAALSPAPNSAGWNSSNVTVTLTAAPAQGGAGVSQITYSTSGAQGIANTVVPGSSTTFGISNEGLTTITFFASDTGGDNETPNTTVVSIDKTPPAINCGAADGQWHVNDVSIGCSASDTLSGLANSSDGSFVLSTSVPAGTETSSASTGSHSVCDVAGNCANAGPVSGNKVDKKPPTINITAPANATYSQNQAVAAAYTCTDGGSGVASCAGPVGSGANINTASFGSYTFTVNATDNVGNVASQSVSYSVAYNICLLYDPTKAVQSGSTIPLKLQLCDSRNADVSSGSIVVHATSLAQVSTNASEIIQASGNANPDNDFRYDSTLGPTGGYIFNLSTKGLTTGSYALSFTAGADPTTHTITFQVR